MRRRAGTWALAGFALISLSSGCSGEEGHVTKPDDASWTGAVALTAQEDHAFGVATDGTHVVFSTGGSQVGENAVRIVPLDGSAPSTIIVANPAGLIPSGALAIDDDAVYVGAGRSILRVPLLGGSVEELVVDRPADITSLAVDGSSVYWTTSALNRPNDAELARASTSGGAVEVLADPATGHGSYSSVVVDGSGGAYAASPAGIVHGVPGRPPTVVVSAKQASSAVTRIAFDGTNLYGIVAGGRHDLFTVPGGGGELTELTRSADAVKAVIPVAGGVAYFSGRQLLYVARTGGPPTVIATGPYAEGSLAAFGTTLVFPADWRMWQTVVAA